MSEPNRLMHGLTEYIEENEEVSPEEERKSFSAADQPESFRCSEFSKDHVKRLEVLIEDLGESFHEMLFRKIEESGLTDADVYKRAFIDRKLFSKIRSNPAYHPRKGTVIALAIALHLDLHETVELLTKSEYAFSPGNKGDLIVTYFIERQIYDINVINYALHEFEQPLLGE